MAQQKTVQAYVASSAYGICQHLACNLLSALTMCSAQGLLKRGYTMFPTSTMPSVLQVGTSSVGAPSPGRQAAILTNLPGWPDLHIKKTC